MNTPGRSCPLRYRYGTAALGASTVREAETLYVIGGLYGNLPALDAIEAMAAAEPGPVRRVFNGDFNWFNVDPAGFEAINRRVLAHEAILGNVEAELGADGLEAGCGCAYPAEVPEAVVQRSNRIHARLRATAAAFPEILAQLAELSMFARYRVGGLTVGVVHGDAESLAGWRFGVEGADDPAGRQWIEDAFAAAGVAVFASTHTCLPLLRRYAGGVLINNGAAGDELLIDNHGSPIDRAVWALYEFVLTRLGPTPTLIERDNDIPPLEVLLGEAQAAERLLVSASHEVTA